MRMMGINAVYRRPRTSLPAPGHTIYPYLLRNLTVERPNQVWASDITYLPMARGFLYLVAIMDWYSRKVLAWRLSNTLTADFCVAALEHALARYGVPEIFNTDQGCQFTGAAVAQRQVRRGLPACIRRRCPSARRNRGLLHFLQRATDSSGAWQMHAR